MAGDWIKMRVDLANDPAVIGLASMLKTDEDDVVGKLHRLWSWADKHTVTGFVPHISEKWIDKYVAKPGFAKQLCAVGWLEIDVTGVTFPHFERHNGASAKLRAENTERTRLSRIKRAEEATESAQMSQKKCDKNAIREEKRREESKPPKAPAISEAVDKETEGGASQKIGAIDPATGEVVQWAA